MLGDDNYGSNCAGYYFYVVGNALGRFGEVDDGFGGVVGAIAGVGGRWAVEWFFIVGLLRFWSFYCLTLRSARGRAGSIRCGGKLQEGGKFEMRTRWGFRGKLTHQGRVCWGFCASRLIWDRHDFYFRALLPQNGLNYAHVQKINNQFARTFE